jgi:hypothetical protein
MNLSQELIVIMIYLHPITALFALVVVALVSALCVHVWNLWRK